MCGLNPIILFVSSDLKPFITDITIISIVTPSIIPKNENGIYYKYVPPKVTEITGITDKDIIKEGYNINWKELEKQNLNQTINTLAMASPFSLEEKQILLETNNLNERKKKLELILSTYNFNNFDNFDNKTIQ